MPRKGKPMTRVEQTTSLVLRRDPALRGRISSMLRREGAPTEAYPTDGFWAMTLKPKGQFDAFRRKYLGRRGTLATFGCPKGQWDPQKESCRVGMKLHRVDVPKGRVMGAMKAMPAAAGFRRLRAVANPSIPPAQYPVPFMGRFTRNAYFPFENNPPKWLSRGWVKTMVPVKVWNAQAQMVEAQRIPGYVKGGLGIHQKLFSKDKKGYSVTHLGTGASVFTAKTFKGAGKVGDLLIAQFPHLWMLGEEIKTHPSTYQVREMLMALCSNLRHPVSNPGAYFPFEGFAPNPLLMTVNPMNPWDVVVGGSPQARLRWPKRTYKTKKSAKRRVRQIREARDIGLETIWTIPTGKDAKKKARRQTVFAVANPPATRTLPYRRGQTIPLQEFLGWLQSQPQQVKASYNKALAEYRKFHLGSDPTNVTYQEIDIGGNEVYTPEILYSAGPSPAEMYEPPASSGKAPNAYNHEYETKPQVLIGGRKGMQFVLKPLTGSARVDDWFRG